jgi:hypothetical protein
MNPNPLPARPTSEAENEVARIVRRLARHFRLHIAQERPWIIDYDRSRYHLELLADQVYVVFEPPEQRATPIVLEVALADLYKFLFETMNP